MLNIVLRTSALIVALTGLALTNLKACPEIKPAEKIEFKSRYSGKVILDGARQVKLWLVLDGKGGGSGVLTFDPNLYEDGSATQIAIKDIAVRAKLIHDENHAAKGRRLYELKIDTRVDQLLESKLRDEPVRWFLVVPEKKGMPSWFVLADKDGKFQDIIVME